MASAKKSAKRTGKKRPTVKKKRSRTRKGLAAARDGFDSVLEAGGRTWRSLKKTTALMMEGVKETFAVEPETRARRRRRR